jgi:BirA family transcriptional regulator, biotin operon repressor / biotin---[acetyl-CoA-carboxylase] ligase
MGGDLGRREIATAIHGRFGTPLRLLESIDSTNDEGLRWARQGAPEGALVVAEHQTAGRGRSGRTWIDSPGSLLMFSLLLRPPAGDPGTSLLTTALGVACAEAVEAVTGVSPLLKWPNDVTVGGRKLAGILLDAHTRAGAVEVVVAGCGINFGWRRSEMPGEIAAGATSVAEELAATHAPGEPGGAGRPTRAALLAAVLASYERLVDSLRSGRSDAVLGPAASRSAILGRRVTVRLSGEETLEGVATRLLPSGALEVRAGDAVRALEVGDVVLVRPA